MVEKQFTLFGIPFTIGQKKDIVSKETQGKSFVSPSSDDGAVEIKKDDGLSAGGSFYQKISYGLTYENEAALINKYRSMALTADVDSAIDEIVNEVMSFDAEESPVDIVLDDVDQSAGIKAKIKDEFDVILKLFNFNNKGDDLFRRWYIDGRLFFHIVVPAEKAKEGITELRYIDSRKIKKIREMSTDKDPVSGVETITKVEEYYVFKDSNTGSTLNQAIQVPAEAVIYTHSGIVDEDKEENTVVLSYLHKAIKPWNLLNMMEDADVIYKISRAPERRIFYIDVGNLPKTAAESYMTNIISKYKNKLVYDSNSGTVKDSTHTSSMLEDIWLPRREGSRGTEVSSLQGGTGLGVIENIEYFKKKQYRALHIPLSRMEGEGQFSLGQSESITRDEIKFSKYIAKLRKRFSTLFLNALKVQLVLKNIINIDEWDEIEENLRFRYNLDQYFQELKEAEIRTAQLEQLGTIDEYVGRYFSIDYVKKKILKQSDDEIEDIAKQIKKEKEEELMPADAGFDTGDGGGDAGAEEEPEEEPADDENEEN